MYHVDYKENRSAETLRFVKEHLSNWGFNTIGLSQKLVSEFSAGLVTHSPKWGPEQYAEARMLCAHLLCFTDIE